MLGIKGPIFQRNAVPVLIWAVFPIILRPFRIWFSLPIYPLAGNSLSLTCTLQVKRGRRESTSSITKVRLFTPRWFHSTFSNLFLT